jgi:hypothetical protein
MDNVKEILDNAMKSLDSMSKANSASLEAFQKLRPKNLGKKCKIKIKTFDLPRGCTKTLTVGGAVLLEFDNPKDGEAFYNV